MTCIGLAVVLVSTMAHATPTPTPAPSPTPSPATAHALIEELSFERNAPLKSFHEELSSFWNEREATKETDGGGIGNGEDEEFFDAMEYCDDHDEEGLLRMSPTSARALQGIRCGHVKDTSRRFRSGAGHIHPIHDAEAEANNGTDHRNFVPLPPPPPPKEVPERFLRAGKGDPEVGRQRYEKTLAWREANGIDGILREPHPDFALIKRNYPHYYHLRGRNNEPVFYEIPPKTDLKAMKAGGVDLEGLLRHYAMVTEFQWQFLERDDFARSITVIDLNGMGMRDFMGECVDYVRRCSEFTGQHYPERAGVVLVVNVPKWFKIIWNVVKPMVDEVTLQKIRILRGKREIFESLQQLVPVENIPPEYGGTSVPLGESPEERLLRDLMQHNNDVAAGKRVCGGKKADCPFCTFVPVRSY